MTSLVSARGIGKRFGAPVALSGVDVDIRAGEVLALLGDNGAGKPTFVKILAVAESPSEGGISVDGAPVAFASPSDAVDAGIATIFQELALSENLSIAENVFLGRELVRRVAGVPFLRRAAMPRCVAGLLTELDAHVADPHAAVGSLSGGQRQAVAICRALEVNARLVIMDEPTAALAVAETRKVLNLIRRLAERGLRGGARQPQHRRRVRGGGPDGGVPARPQGRRAPLRRDRPRGHRCTDHGRPSRSAGAREGRLSR